MQAIIYSSALLASITALILSIYALRTPAWIRFDTPASSPFQYSTLYGLRQKCDKSNLHPEFQCRSFPARDRDCKPNQALRNLIQNPQEWWTQSERNFNSSTTNTIATTTGSFSNMVVPVGSGLVHIHQNDHHSIETMESSEGFGFCEKWNTAAYTAELGVAVGAISLICIFIVLLGNEHRKEHGWKVCAGLIAVHALLQTISWAFVLQVFNSDDRFYFGSKLFTSFYVAISGSIIDYIAFTALVVAGFTGLVSCSDDDSRGDYEPIP